MRKLNYFQLFLLVSGFKSVLYRRQLRIINSSFFPPFLLSFLSFFFLLFFVSSFFLLKLPFFLLNRSFCLTLFLHVFLLFFHPSFFKVTFFLLFFLPFFLSSFVPYFLPGFLSCLFSFFLWPFSCSLLSSFIHSGDLYSASSRHYYSKALPAQSRPKKKDLREM